MAIDLEPRRRARRWITLLAALAFLVAALVPWLKGQPINVVMLSLAVVFLALSAVWGPGRRR